ELSFGDIAAWLMLWLPVNLKWHDPTFGDLDIRYWNMVLSVVLVIGWGCIRPTFNLEYPIYFCYVVWLFTDIRYNVFPSRKKDILYGGAIAAILVGTISIFG